MTAPPPGNGKPNAIAVFTSHWLAMVGLWLVLVAIVLWLCLLGVKLRHGEDHPYIGVVMTIVGGILILGAIITPIGMYFGRRRLKQQVVSGAVAWRRFFIFIAVTSVLNLLIASGTAVKTVHALESHDFCVSCHVHAPQEIAFEAGPHDALLCVDCHVGEGAKGFITAKLQGTRQLWHVMTDSVHHPIEGAIESGRNVASAETCESCHSSEKQAAAKVRMIRRYAEDEANTPQTTLLTMNVGGSVQGGIHGAHFGTGMEVRFVATDKKRQDIPLVEVVDAQGAVVRTYVKQGTDAAAYANQPRITMQCYDCHNRVAHVLEMPGPAVDKALMLGRMSATLPFLKKTAVEILEKEYASQEAAGTEIPAALAAYYAQANPDVSSTRAADIQTAGKVLAEIHNRNVYPDLKVTWGTYENNIGHQDFPGCFRCHEGNHVTSAGEEINKNCFVCHFPAAVGDTSPEVLKMLGVDRMLKKLETK